MPVLSRAETIWEGDLMTGNGTVSAKTGAFAALPVNWKARSEGGPNTTPEELIAAAHASCFSMAFSARLAKNGTPPQRLTVACTVTFQPGQGIKASDLEVTGAVKGIDAATFEKLALDAKENCPVSMALKGNVPLSVKATLAA